MKKKFAGAVAAAVLAAAVTGCSGSADTAKETKETAAQTQAETDAQASESADAAEEKSDLAGTEITVMVPGLGKSRRRAACPVYRGNGNQRSDERSELG